LVSFSSPSKVSPTTGSPKKYSPAGRRRTSSPISASRTTPSECVFVSPIGDDSRPLSRIHSRPVSSPLPLSRCDPANMPLSQILPSPGTITVTPVLTGPTPTRSAPSPEIRVVWPTRTPGTSVIAFSGPRGSDPIAIPTSAARTR